MRSFRLSAVLGFGSGRGFARGWATALAREGEGIPGRLSDARMGERIRLFEASGKEALTWLLLSGWQEEVEVDVLHAGWGGVVLSIQGRRIAVPGWVARAALVTRTR